MTGAPLAELLESLMVAPVQRRPSLAGPTVEVYPLALPLGEGVTIPLGHFGEIGFANGEGLLVLTVPWGMAAWLREKLGDAIVRVPEAGLSLDGTVRVAQAWVRLRAGMRESSPLGAPGECGGGEAGQVGTVVRAACYGRSSRRCGAPMLAAKALSNIPEARVTPWVRFDDLWGRPASDLHRAGGYLVGLFDELPAEVRLTPASGRLIYVGETHGPSTNIETRLWSLAYSIGIVKEGHWGHVAGHSFNRHFGQPDRWAEATGQLAVAPIPVEMNATTAPDLRGVLPLLVEKTLLAAHVRRAGRMPLLNDYERVMPVEWQPHPPADALAQALAEPLTETNSTELASWLAKACMWKGRTAPTEWYANGAWSGWKAIPKRGWSVYLGRSTGADHLDWSAWAETRATASRLEPAREIRTLRDAGEVAFAFQYGWRTSFDAERWW